MYSNKYLTIDPLILQTLNLNEKRMNHILDILHGNPTKRNNAKNNQNINQLSTLNKTELTTNRKISLPSILKLKQNNQNNNNKQARKKSLIFTKQTNKYKDNEEDQSQSKKKTVKQINIQRRVAKSAKKQLATIQKQFEQQMMPDSKALKKIQLLHSYAKKNKPRLQKSKSQIINPKDLYRLQIEDILAEETQIHRIQESQNRMKRVKRRHKHLLKFDKEYYSKLNQNQLMLL